MLAATRQTPHHLLRCKPLGSRSKCYESWGQRRFTNDGLVLKDRAVPYRQVAAISHCNRRHIVNFVPAYETFCILVKDSSGNSVLLFDQIKLRKYAGAGGLLTGFKIPPEIEAKLSNLRYEYLATLEVLKQKSGVEPRQRGLLFEYWMEVLSLFKSTHAAPEDAGTASQAIAVRSSGGLPFRIGKWLGGVFRK